MREKISTEFKEVIEKIYTPFEINTSEITRPEDIPVRLNEVAEALNYIEDEIKRLNHTNSNLIRKQEAIKEIFSKIDRRYVEIKEIVEVFMKENSQVSFSYPNYYENMQVNLNEINIGLDAISRSLGNGQ